MTRLVTWLGFALSAWLVGSPLSVSAQQAEGGSNEARELFVRGTTAYQQGDYETAIREWEAAYRLDARPGIQYNISQAYERLGRPSNAITALEAYLAGVTPNDPNEANARARLASLRERVGRTSIVVTGGPEGATILIDGTDKGRTPRPDPILVAPGAHQVVVRHAGFRDFTAQVSVTAGESTSVTVAMEEASGSSPLPYIVMGAGGASLLVGAILGVTALGRAGDAMTSDDSDAKAARKLALGADVLMGVGIAAIGTGVALLIFGGGGEEEAPAAAGSARLHVVPTVSPTFAGAAATLTF